MTKQKLTGEKNEQRFRDLCDYDKKLHLRHKAACLGIGLNFGYFYIQASRAYSVRLVKTLKLP